jgi:NAD(P)-dependent dehydrogenase (short-subunit alcohol dehydrogenase family)
MRTALIIGASRGIGREFARQYRADGWRVIATARKEEDLADLTAIGCEALALDVTSAAECAAIAARLEGERLDVAIQGAGVLGQRSQGLEAPTEEIFDTVMHTNVLAAMRLLPAIGPLVANAGGRLAVISSRMGSIGLRNDSSSWLYRASKAALNSVLADAALELGPRGAVCVAFHPGWVRTEMGGAGAELPVEQSVSGMRATLAALTAKDNGSFLNYDGKQLTW